MWFEFVSAMSEDMGHLTFLNTTARENVFKFRIGAEWRLRTYLRYACGGIKRTAKELVNSEVPAIIVKELELMHCCY